MKTRQSYLLRIFVVLSLVVCVTVLSARMKADTGTCGTVTITLPFTDVMGSIFFCQIAEAYFSGLTNGTTASTYSPGQTVTREQMAAFITRTMDQSLKRGSKRAVAKKWWTPQDANSLTLTPVGSLPQLVKSDGVDVWVTNFGASTVSRVRTGDGKLLETWTGATAALGVMAAKGLIFATRFANPGSLYQIDPTQAVGAVTTLPISLGAFPEGMSFDGARVWTANFGLPGSVPGSVSIVTLNPLSVTTVTTGFTDPIGLAYDGANMWVVDSGAGSLFELDANGAIIKTVAVGTNAKFPVFDGTNIWVPNSVANNVTVIRASTGAVVATLTGNGLNGPFMPAFDGERILVTNFNGNSVSLWKATDLTPLGSFSTGAGTSPSGACSDGLNFWITLRGTGKLARF